MPRINYISTNGPGGAVQTVSQLNSEASDYGYVEIGSDNLNSPGSFPFRVDQSGNVSANGTPMLQLVATTGTAGYSLGASPGIIISWTAPNDGKLHRVSVIAQQFNTNTVSAGTINTEGTDPGGNAFNFDILPTAGSGAHVNGAGVTLIEAGSTVSVQQVTALSGGPSKVWVEIWGS